MKNYIKYVKVNNKQSMMRSHTTVEEASLLSAVNILTSFIPTVCERKNDVSEMKVDTLKKKDCGR